MDLVGQHWIYLCGLMPLYRAITTVTIDDGRSSVFRRDRWLREEPLCFAMSVLFSHSTCEDVFVERVLSDGLDVVLVLRLSSAAE